MSKDYLWCPRCNRAYATNEQRRVGALEMCPYAECKGRKCLAVAWPEVRRCNPWFPPEPLRAHFYPFSARARDEDLLAAS